jgi:hypothetical protein
MIEIAHPVHRRVDGLNRLLNSETSESLHQKTNRAFSYVVLEILTSRRLRVRTAWIAHMQIVLCVSGIFLITNGPAAALAAKSRLLRPTFSLHNGVRRNNVKEGKAQARAQKLKLIAHTRA